MTNKAYRRPLAGIPQGPRRGLSAYAGQDLSRYALAGAPAGAPIGGVVGADSPAPRAPADAQVSTPPAPSPPRAPSSLPPMAGG
jgi:hypothetical protein